MVKSDSQWSNMWTRHLLQTPTKRVLIMMSSLVDQKEHLHFDHLLDQSNLYLVDFKNKKSERESDQDLTKQCRAQSVRRALTLTLIRIKRLVNWLLIEISLSLFCFFLTEISLMILLLPKSTLRFLRRRSVNSCWLRICIGRSEDWNCRIDASICLAKHLLSSDVVLISHLSHHAKLTVKFKGFFRIVFFSESSEVYSNGSWFSKRNVVRSEKTKIDDLLPSDFWHANLNV